MCIVKGLQWHVEVHAINDVHQPIVGHLLLRDLELSHKLCCHQRIYIVINNYLCMSRWRSFIYIKKSLEPLRVPCGTPPFSMVVDDSLLFTLTLCVRSRRNAAFHLRR